LLSKILLVVLLFMLASKLGLRTKLRELKPKIDRAVNITIVVVVVAYVGQLLWLLVQKHAVP
jgi:Kef-type K+ transport system membrane component KefB